MSETLLPDFLHDLGKYLQTGVIGVLSGFTIFLALKNKLSKSDLDTTRNSEEKSLISFLSSELKERREDSDRAVEKATQAETLRLEATQKLREAEAMVSRLQSEVHLLHSIVTNLNEALAAATLEIDKLKDAINLQKVQGDQVHDQTEGRS